MILMTATIIKEKKKIDTKRRLQVANPFSKETWVWICRRNQVSEVARLQISSRCLRKFLDVTIALPRFLRSQFWTNSSFISFLLWKSFIITRPSNISSEIKEIIDYEVFFFEKIETREKGEIFWKLCFLRKLNVSAFLVSPSCGRGGSGVASADTAGGGGKRFQNVAQSATLWLKKML